MPTLNWIGKDKVVNHAATVPFHVLEHKYNFGGESENKIIHGYNLLALKFHLTKYEGRIKCIYISSKKVKIYQGMINGYVMYPRIILLKKFFG